MTGKSEKGLRSARVRLDEIGYWSELKLQIVRDYASAYTTIMSRQKVPFEYWYVDAFSGAGLHLEKYTGKLILGSPLNALGLDHPFSHYLFVDLHGGKIQALKENAKSFPCQDRVEFEQGDCNDILLRKVFGRLKWSEYKRALFLLDPYGLHLNWEIIQQAGQSKAIEIFLNFPVLDINRNVLWTNPEGVDPEDEKRMNRIWGDGSYRALAYRKDLNLFQWEEKRGNAIPRLVEVFRERLKKVAGFSFVPEPIPMRNKSNAIMYYLFFASPNRTGGVIVKQIFDKFRNWKQENGSSFPH